MNPEFAPTESKTNKTNGKWIIAAVIGCIVLFGCIATLLIVRQNTGRTTPVDQRVATVVFSDSGFYPASIDLTENNRLAIDNQTPDTVALFTSPSLGGTDSDRYAVAGEQYTMTFDTKGKYVVSAGKLDPKQLVVTVK